MKVVEVKSEYYQDGGESVNVTLSNLNMQPPIYVYYELSNYYQVNIVPFCGLLSHYQNHRRYVKSRSDEQLRGVLIKKVLLLSFVVLFTDRSLRLNPVHLLSRKGILESRKTCFYLADLLPIRSLTVWLLFLINFM